MPPTTHLLPTPLRKSQHQIGPDFYTTTHRDACDDSPAPHAVDGPDSEEGTGARHELAGELELLGLVAGQLLPVPAVLVPLQLVVGDGRAVVLGGVPAQGQGAFRPAGDARGEGLRGDASRNHQTGL